MRRVKYQVGMVATALALVLPGSAFAANISVTTTADTVGAGGGCSLREAISAANGDTTGPGGDCTEGDGADVIKVPASNDPYLIAIGPAGDDDNANGDFDLGPDGITIEGGGAGDTVIDGDGVDRVFDVHGGTPTFRALTITGGHAPDGADGGIGADGADGQVGGGIRNDAGALTLDGVVVQDNQAGDGGDGGNGPTGGPSASTNGGNGGLGGTGGGIDSNGIVSIIDSAIAHNAAGDGGNGGAGGTAGNGADAPTGGNGGNSSGGAGWSGGDGGGVNSSTGTVTIGRSAIVGNRAGTSGIGGAGGTAGDGGDGTAGNGGNGGNAQGGQSLFPGFGGGLQMSNTAVTITDSTLAGNSGGIGRAGGSGGSGGDGGGGTNSGAAGNAVGGKGADGGSQGAISVTNGSLSISGSSVSDNEAGVGGTGGAGGTGGTAPGVQPDGMSKGGVGGIGGSEGGIGTGGTANGPITSTTVTQNVTGDGGAGGAGGAGPLQSTGGNGGSSGSGAALASNGTATLNHVTVASNFLGAGGAAGDDGTGATPIPGAAGNVGIVGGIRNTNPNAFTLLNTIVASNDGDQCGGIPNNASARVLSFPDDATCPGTLHDDPLLGPLQDNGGPTETLGLGAGSPAIDAVAASGQQCAATDQRGVTRPKGTACDLGAVERSVPAATTGGVSGLSSTGVTLAGIVNPGQLPATYRFEYGTTASYGSQTAPKSAGSGAANVAASQALTGLAPNTTYHYRLRTTNPDGTAIGADATFKTSLTPPSVKSCTGVSILTKSVRLDRKGRAAVRLRARGTAKCAGTLALTRSVKIRRKGKTRRKNVSVGKAKFSIAAGKTKTVRVKVKRGARSIVRRRKKLTTTAKTTARDSAGKARTAKRKLTLKPATKRRR